jgi:predicted GH43/DUF377 family glycosyl hydrolase
MIDLFLSGNQAKTLRFNNRLGKANKSDKTENASYFTWGSSVIKVGETFYMAVTRWTGTINDWPTTGTIWMATSSTLTGPYTVFRECTELKVQGWSNTGVFNPYFLEESGTYYLYYSGTTGADNEEGKDNMLIGVATSTDLTQAFTVYSSNPILTPRVGEWDTGAVTNPAVIKKIDGEFLMIYRSDTIGESQSSRLGVATSNNPIGLWSRTSNNKIDVYSEDPCVYYEKGKYYIIAKVFLTTGNVPPNGGIILESVDGNTWQIASNDLAYTGLINWSDATSETISRTEKPFVYTEGNVPKALFTVCNDNNPTSFNICRLIK